MAWCELIERERMRVMADDYVRQRNTYLDVEEARKYHGRLVNLAAEGRSSG